MALPFLPGNSFDRNIGKDRFHKSQIMDIKNNLHFMFGVHKPGIGGDPLPGQRIPPPTSLYPGGEGRSVPAWLAFDKQVLSFMAYCQEPVHERRDETYRIRNVLIYFYLEDDSIQMIEPRYRNSGLAQGTILRRHRVHKPPPHDDLFYTVHDFNVGIEMNFYNKVYKIIGCDEFTHNFLRKLGVRVNEPELPPDDPYTNYRKAFDDAMQPLRPYIRVDTLRQFLDHDRHVLRFYCFWDDTESLYGDPREMVLHYYLSDDTVEIREVIPINAGRDSGSLFLRRQKLPKHMDDLPQPGDGNEKICLNVLGKIHSGRYLIDSLKTGAVHIDCYKDSDLTIGTYINVYGRKFLICDCDEFTKEYYRTKYGITEFKPIPYTINKTKPIEKMPVPFNGWGTEEDSLGNCEHFIPKPPIKDFKKFLKLDRHGLETNTLRFHAYLDTDSPIDKERAFIMSYFLVDDTLQIVEPEIPNSGIRGGIFLIRHKPRKPNSERFSIALPDYYTAADFYIGANILINSFRFIIDDADEYCLQYMEKHKDQFAKADVKIICEKLRTVTRGSQEKIRAQFKALDPNDTGKIPVGEVEKLLKEVSKGELTQHEIITMLRHYADRPPKETNVREIIAVTQQQLRKFNFDNFARLSEALVDVDRAGQGKLHPEIIRSVCKTFHIPLPDDLLKAIIEVSGIDDDGLVKAEHFVANVNWCVNPVRSQTGFVDSINDQIWIGEGHRRPNFGDIKDVVVVAMVDDILRKERVPREIRYD